jgi:two-component system LytT family sensor kinase
MVGIINKKYRSVLLQISIWGLLFALPHFFLPSDSRVVKPGFLPSSFFIVTNLYHVALFYFNAYVIYPLFFNKRRWWLFILILAAIAISTYYLKLFITKAWYPQVIMDQWAYRILFFPTLAFLFISTLYRLIADKIQHEKKQKEIVAEQLSVKLKFLRSQINPHFIFNVLTNLVALARKKSDQLEPALLKLSELMRYMLYESDEKKVPLLQEMEYLQSYIDLQKLRFGDDISIEVNIDIPAEKNQHDIEPMMLIPFVENAFKHGTGVDNPFIKVDLTIDNKNLEFNVKNKYAGEITESKDVSSGIGLENVRTRLMLLYPKQHSLIIKKDANIFDVHLTLQMK